MHDPDTAEYIAQLKSPDYYVRREAARALGAMQDAAAVPALLRALKEPLPPVQIEVAAALGSIGDAAAVGALLALLTNSEKIVRWAAAIALRNMGEQTELPRKILAHPRFSAQERLNLLERLERVQYSDTHLTLNFYFSDTRLLCEQVLQEADPEARVGAQEVLHLLEGNLLLRASQREHDNGQELLRAAQGSASESPTDTLLRPSDSPDDNAPPTTDVQPTLWQRLLGKRRYNTL